MPRSKAILQCKFPYNISARSINRDWFSLPMETVWKIFCEELSRVSSDQKLLIHSFVLMSNHYHLIASTPLGNISYCMQLFMRRTSRRMTKAGNRINETFAGRHYKCILQSHNYYLNAYKYNYRNPVTSGLCTKVEDYPYSTLRGLLGLEQQIIFLERDETLLSDMFGTLAWLNTAPTREKLQGVRIGLKRQYFKSAKQRGTNRPLFMDNDVL